MAAAAGMTAKALRHYDRIGLFAPDDVDDDTGYRWYGADRLPQARLIARLRSVGVPPTSLTSWTDWRTTGHPSRPISGRRPPTPPSRQPRTSGSWPSTCSTVSGG